MEKKISWTERLTINENIQTDNGRNEIHNKGHKVTMWGRYGTRSTPQQKIVLYTNRKFNWRTKTVGKTE